MKTVFPTRYSLLTISLLCALHPAYAQQSEAEREVEKIQVLGSNIKVNQDTGALPVTALSAEDIANTGAMSGAELLAELPQQGEVNFSSERVVGGVNDARGDVSSINLRGIGTGNTLTLLNGRRLVLHPGTQSENLVPVTTVNSNTLPVRGLKRLEVLRDGAAAIYGSDAVAGVLNYVLKDDYEGAEINFQYGKTADSDQNRFNLTGVGGWYFNDGASHLTISGGLYQRDPLMASERPYSASSDLREYPGLPEEFVGDTQLDNRSTSSPWGEFRSASLKTFHIQPDTMSGCEKDLGNGLCADKGSLGRDLRYDFNRDRSLSSEVDRFNLYALFNHQLNDDTELFAEALYYKAKAKRTRERRNNLTSQRFTVAANAFYNPFGEAVTVRRYRPVDAGLRHIEVDDYSYRLLTGLKGAAGDWDWESAVLYSKANTLDSANRINTTLFQQAVNSTEQSTAYNIFNGADPANPNSKDSTPNNQSIIDGFEIQVERESETALALADFKVSTPALLEMPAGDLGFAAGIEWRYESFSDVRSNYLNGNSPFVNVATGAINTGSSVVWGSSPTPDADGSRKVFSAFAEFAIPLLEDLPLVERLDMQLAARYENFSDVGSVLKPKVALSWQLNEMFQFRAAFAQGFKAPGLPQVVAKDISRVNTRSDPITDERQGVLEIRNGSDTLKPEESDSFSYGLVIEPTEDLTFTVDWWKIEQEDVVGILNSQTQILYDALLRSQGSSNPFVIRDSNLEIVQVNNDYTNLLPRTIKGLDLAVFWTLQSDIGKFKFKVNAANLREFSQGVDEVTAAVLAAQQAGNNAIKFDGDNVNITGTGDLMRRNGLPEWRYNASISWRYKAFGAGISYKHVTDFEDTSLNYTKNDELINYVVDSWSTLNAYVNYRFDEDSALGNTRITLGAKNLTNEEPPLADETFGYNSSVHSARGRYLYLNLNKKF